MLCFGDTFHGTFWPRPSPPTPRCPQQTLVSNYESNWKALTFLVTIFHQRSSAAYNLFTNNSLIACTLYAALLLVMVGQIQTDSLAMYCSIVWLQSNTTQYPPGHFSQMKSLLLQWSSMSSLLHWKRWWNIAALLGSWPLVLLLAVLSGQGTKVSNSLSSGSF